MHIFRQPVTTNFKIVYFMRLALLTMSQFRAGAMLVAIKVGN